jgi:uncharacterized membrane protein YraQ (UPF0718 family)
VAQAIRTRPIAALRTWRPIGSIALAAAGIAVVLKVLDPTRIAAAQNFFLILAALLIEAVPFVLLGAVVSAAIEVFVPQRAFDKIARLPGPLAAAYCRDCRYGVPGVRMWFGARRPATRIQGVVPVGRSDVHARGADPEPDRHRRDRGGVPGQGGAVADGLGRSGLGLAAAITVGWALGKRSPGELLRSRSENHHDHHGSSRVAGFFSHLSSDFLFMGRYLVLGATVAAGMQTFVPQSLIGAVAGTPIVDLVAMMLLAFVLSLCSESDAFVAASFTQFGVGAQLAFLVFGPLIDTKLSFLYKGTFNRGFLWRVVALVGGVTLAGALWIEVLIG